MVNKTDGDDLCVCGHKRVNHRFLDLPSGPIHGSCLECFNATGGAGLCRRFSKAEKVTADEVSSSDLSPTPPETGSHHTTPPPVYCTGCPGTIDMDKQFVVNLAKGKATCPRCGTAVALPPLASVFWLPYGLTGAIASELAAVVKPIETGSDHRTADKAKVVFKSGAASSKIPRLDLIPRGALIRIATRFELGLERHKERSWNAASDQSCLADEDFITARAAHVIDHALKLIAKRRGQIPDDGDDDAAAIAWGGVFLCEIKNRKEDNAK